MLHVRVNIVNTKLPNSLSTFYESYDDVNAMIFEIGGMLMNVPQGRKYEIESRGLSTVRHWDFEPIDFMQFAVVDWFAETRTVYTIVPATLRAESIESTAELLPFLVVADELERQFGQFRNNSAPVA